jgi:hypothetical protein
MAGPISEYLAQDHARLDGLLRRAMAKPGAVDLEPYAEFRAGLLRHIGIEEKILLPAARWIRGGRPLPVAAQLRRDHGAFAALLVPTPTPEILRQVRALLDLHNPMEEGPQGAYAACEALLGDEAELLAQEMRRAPPPRVAPHYDGPRLHGHVGALRRAGRDLSGRDTGAAT